MLVFHSEQAILLLRCNAEENLDGFLAAKNAWTHSSKYYVDNMEINELVLAISQRKLKIDSLFYLCFVFFGVTIFNL